MSSYSLISLLSLVFSILCILAVFVEGQAESDNSEVEKMKQYLVYYGYYDSWARREMDYEKALKKFQSFSNLNVSGILDEATKKRSLVPRCGVRDEISNLANKYNHQGTVWKKNVVTWKYGKESSKLSRDTVRSIIKTAMKKWSDEANIVFEESTEKDADIVIKFDRDNHNDPYPFDGAGKAFAHAFFPYNNKGLSGDIHLDDSDDFTTDGDDSSGMDLLWVLTHEIGHSLGLDHTADSSHVMYPFYQGDKKDVKLQDGDVIGIQSLYGSKPL